jgi:hypothetical protein
MTNDEDFGFRGCALIAAVSLVGLSSLDQCGHPEAVSCFVGEIMDLLPAAA